MLGGSSRHFGRRARNLVAVGTLAGVANRGDHGRAERRDCAAQRLIRERQEILDAATAAREDDHVDVGDGRNGGQRLDQIVDRANALHERVADGDSGRGEAVAQRADDIGLGIGVAAGHETDAAGEAGQRQLRLGFRQSLGAQSIADVEHALEQLALAGRSNCAADQRHRAALGVVIDLRVTRLDQPPLHRWVGQVRRSRAPHDAANRRLAIAQREVQVARRRDRNLLHLAFDDSAAERAERTADAAPERAWRLRNRLGGAGLHPATAPT